jgi:hypothetical protein
MTRALEVTQPFRTFAKIFRLEVHELNKRIGVPEEGVAG